MVSSQSSVRLQQTGQGALEGISTQLGARIAQSNLDLPMLPKVAGAVISMTQDETADMAGLSRLIQQDPALASRVMKIANSPNYRGRSPMSSLQQAIARMGMKVISEMALSASVGGEVFTAKGFESEVAWLWRHSVASAGWAKEIARIRRRNVESAFMCGLLHQIGKPVALQAIADIRDQLGVEVSSDEMQQLIRQYHVLVGLSLGKAWELPAMVIESIEYSQSYEQAPQFGREATITSGAGLLASQLLSEEGLDAQVLLESQVMADLNLYDEDVELLITQADGIKSMVEVMAI